MLSIHTLLSSTNESSRTACIEGIDQDIEFTLLLISSVPFISHSGKQCWPVTADQDWVVIGLGTSKGNKGQVSNYMLKCKCHSRPRRLQGNGWKLRDADEPASAFMADLGSRRMALQPREHQPGTELKDTGRNCDERHMMVSGNLKRPEISINNEQCIQHL